MKKRFSTAADWLWGALALVLAATATMLLVSASGNRAGVQIMYENAGQRQENQIKAIRFFIAYQVDVTAFAPFSGSLHDNLKNGSDILSV